MTVEEIELLQELIECGGLIDDTNYTDQQRRVLEKLSKTRPCLVALAWRISDEGRRVLRMAVQSA